MNLQPTKFSRISMLTGIKREMTFNVNPAAIEAYKNGGLIQDCFPNLSPSEREFIKTGITEEEWDFAFKESEDS